MAIRKKTSTTRLPQSLQQQIDETSGNNANDHPHWRSKSRHQLSRKDARKQERDSRKQKKAEHFSQAQNMKKRSAEWEPVESVVQKKARHEVSKPSSSGTLAPSISILKTQTSSHEKRQQGVTPVSKESSKKPVNGRIALKKPVEKFSSSALSLSQTQREEEEDKYIAYLESQLGYSKGAKRKNPEDEDGLDDLMDWADAFNMPSSSSGALLPANQNSDFEDEEDEDSQESEEDEEESSEEDWGGIDESEVDEDESPAPQEEEKETEINSTTYVPPHLRYQNKDNTNSEEMQKLTRQLKGLLNRMSEQNLATILDSIEELYRNNRRNDVTSMITKLIVDGVSAHSLLLDSYVVLHAAFISSLHKIIGVEFAAHFVQTAVATYEKHYADLQNPKAEAKAQEQADDNLGKECSNLIVLISELYNFQVISSVLVFDIIRSLLHGDLSEFSVELLLKMVRNSGYQLRQDDPSALKDIITIVQGKVAGKEDNMSSRTRFMIETLINLKNNKLKRNITQNQGGEAVERMKKFLSGLSKKKHVLAHDPLRVSLEDLHSSEKKGKWWLVGAAWGGDPLVDRQQVVNESEKMETSRTAEPADDLLKLARKHGMNTDIRRSIFVVLMSSDDYVDACERLSQLNLAEVQQREIIRVILHCCGNEKTYNPYYTLVGQQLCRTSHGSRITLQYCLWDFLRDLGESSVGGAEVIKNMKDTGFEVKSVSKTRLKNVASAYAWWIAKDAVTLAILKPVDFTMLKPQTQEFLRELMIQIFLFSQTSTPLIGSNIKAVSLNRNRGAIEEIFIKASRMETLAMGLVYFLGEIFRDASFEDDGVSKFIHWAASLAKETLRTGLDIIPTL